jgi:sigma-E factor negative regulatory protein RseA
MKETISEIIDQRVDPHRLSDPIERIAADAEGCTTWRNYHLIGDVIRGEVSFTGGCLVSRVQTALHDEPTVLAPVATARQATGSDDRASDDGPRAVGRGDTLKAAGLFAIAASLALVAVITQLPGSDEASLSPAIATIGDEGITTDNEENDTATDPDRQHQDFASEFGQMLVEHGEFSATAGLNGLLAYAKVVSNEPLGAGD